MIALGWRENFLQAVLQGVLAGPAAIYLFARSIALLGAGRAAVFPTLVPPFVLLIGWLALGEVPSVLQLIGLVIVLFGFQLAQRTA
jgi:drug/metabolite transporter (DMT)-like permease